MMTEHTLFMNPASPVTGSPSGNRPTGYLHRGYAESLSEFGTPRELPHSGGWLLERVIPGYGSSDATGCYPLFACREWSALQRDLDDLEGSLVSVALVADPFGNYDRSLLEACFDMVMPFKQHFVADLSEPAEAIVSKHHRTYAVKALDDVRVEICQEPPALLDDWVSLYRSLTEKHGVRGIRAFSRRAFAKQLEVPGMVALRAERDGVVVAANLFYVQGETVYDHLTASSPEGYQLRAAYALKWRAIHHFTGKARWINWGGGAGALSDASDGLTLFKKGWAQATRPAYFCGRILDKKKYRDIVTRTKLEGIEYFPAYRSGEFS